VTLEELVLERCAGFELNISRATRLTRLHRNSSYSTLGLLPASLRSLELFGRHNTTDPQLILSSPTTPCSPTSCAHLDLHTPRNSLARLIIAPGYLTASPSGVVAALQAITALRFLYIDPACMSHPLDLSCLSQLHTLVITNLPRRPDPAVCALPAGLTELHVHFAPQQMKSPLSFACLRGLSHLHRLASLCVWNARIHAPSLLNIATLSTLRHATIRNCTMHGTDSKQLRAELCGLPDCPCCHEIDPLIHSMYAQ
jgi:hypothetical protein